MLWPVSQNPSTRHTMMITSFPCTSSQLRSAANCVLAAGANTAYSSRTMKLDVASRQNDASAR